MVTKTNETIAKALGFKKVKRTLNGKPDGYVWHYPDGWEDFRTGEPERTVPDFVGYIHIIRELHRKFRYGGLKQRFG